MLTHMRFCFREDLSERKTSHEEIKMKDMKNWAFNGLRLVGEVSTVVSFSDWNREAAPGHCGLAAVKTIRTSRIISLAHDRKTGYVLVMTEGEVYRLVGPSKPQQKAEANQKSAAEDLTIHLAV